MNLPIVLLLLAAGPQPPLEGFPPGPVPRMLSRMEMAALQEQQASNRMARVALHKAALRTAVALAAAGGENPAGITNGTAAGMARAAEILDTAAEAGTEAGTGPLEAGAVAGVAGFVAGALTRFIRKKENGRTEGEGA